jgi:membrane protease YdiL (CAAX protease family)
MHDGSSLPPAHETLQAPARPRRLRRAPEQREMSLILGLAFFLNLSVGFLLQWVSFRWGLLLSQTLFIAGPALLAIRWFYLDPGAILPMRRPTRLELAAVMLATAGLNHLLNIAGAWQERIFPMPELWRRVWDNLLSYRGPGDYAVLLLLFGPVAALCEEILFRGFLQSGLVHVLESAPLGIVVCSLVFAAFHLDPWRFPALVIMGLFLGYLVHATGSLIPAVLSHALNNVLSIALAGASADPGMLPGTPPTAALALALLAAGLLLLRRAGRWAAPARVI